MLIDIKAHLGFFLLSAFADLISKYIKNVSVSNIDKIFWGMHLKHIEFLSNIGGYENPQESNRI